MKISLEALALLFVSIVSVTSNARASSANQVVTYKCDEAYDKVMVKFENKKAVAIFGIVVEGDQLGTNETLARSNVVDMHLRVSKDRNTISLAIVVGENGETQRVRCRRVS